MPKTHIFACGCENDHLVKIDISGYAGGQDKLFARFCPKHYMPNKSPRNPINESCRLQRTEMPCEVCGKPARVRVQDAETENVTVVCAEHKHLRKKLANNKASVSHCKQPDSVRKAPAIKTTCIRCGKGITAKGPFTTKTPKVFCSDCRWYVNNVADYKAVNRLEITL